MPAKPTANPATPPTALLPALEATLHGKFTHLRFAPPLEAHYLTDTAPARSRRYVLLGLIAAVLFNIFNFTDQLMLPDVYQLAWMIRLTVVTPLMLVMLALGRLGKLDPYLDAMAMTLGLLCCISLVFIMNMSSHANAIHYVKGLMLTFMYVSIVVRMHFWYTLASAILIMAAAGPTIMSLAGSAIELKINSLVELTATMVISLMANYQMEFEARREYLRNLRETLRTSALAAENAALSKIATLDALTGLASRRQFDTQLQLIWQQAEQLNRPMSLIFIDVDHFKRFNDHYGHPEGDRCLMQIGEVIRSSLQRHTDLAARYGGEEFVVLLKECAPEDALIVARRIRQAMQNRAIPHADSPTAQIVTLSLGIAGGMPSEFNTAATLIEAADDALYQAKSHGRNRVVTFNKAHLKQNITG
ncbi:diguanylate cyclase (GGDEF)-like protein [Chitinivorax tropicus]|uniref:diguanylate cyclase n=1 Tax=Chitinivorax tropicus TaxID=714531 RepID=A0A840MNF9_9PROT|nr:diguanylate cyclase [Chitinivorax tropicus]MBB5018527.1 diguanylate cyclase (GGDEF)-like protein [Chitinivorax tropicus]